MAHPHPDFAGWVEPISAAVVVGALLQVLPAAAAFMAALWYGVCLWDSAVGQRWRSRWRGLFYIARGTPMVNTDLDALKKQLSDIQHAREDRLLLAFVLGLGGAGIAMVLLVLSGI